MTRRLNTKQYQAAIMTAEGIGRDVIESQLNLQRNTLTRWQRIPEFQEAINQRITDIQQSMSYRLLALRSEAFTQFEAECMKLYGYRGFHEIHKMICDANHLIHMPVCPPPKTAAKHAKQSPKEQKSPETMQE